MRSTGRPELLLLLCALGCGGHAAARAPQPVEAQPTDPASVIAAAQGNAQGSAPQSSSTDADLADQASEVIAAALNADAHQENVDTLYTRGAIVIADGHRRDQAPRFAGVEPGGAVAVGDMQVVVREKLVWAVFEYRWYSVNDNLARQAQATVLLAPPDGARGFRIVHVHSSMVR